MADDTRYRVQLHAHRYMRMACLIIDRLTISSPLRSIKRSSRFSMDSHNRAVCGSRKYSMLDTTVAHTSEVPDLAQRKHEIRNRLWLTDAHRRPAYQLSRQHDFADSSESKSRFTISCAAPSRAACTAESSAIGCRPL